ncbi:unnamed protein product [Rhizophagus irregularis]|nr:unnamed protein product [Rhizophagus irregularis]
MDNNFNFINDGFNSDLRPPTTDSQAENPNANYNASCNYNSNNNHSTMDDNVSSAPYTSNVTISSQSYPTTSSDPPHPLVPQYTQQQIQQVQQPGYNQNGENNNIQQQFLNTTQPITQNLPHFIQNNSSPYNRYHCDRDKQKSQIIKLYGGLDVKGLHTDQQTGLKDETASLKPITLREITGESNDNIVDEQDNVQYETTLAADDTLFYQRKMFSVKIYYHGSKVLEGVGTYIVTDVGVNSFFGKIMMSLRSEAEDTPLQEKLNDLAEKIAKLDGAAALLMFIVLLIKYFASFRYGVPSKCQIRGFLFLSY